MTGLLGAIAFDPNIRGVLVVLVGATVLIGSIFLVVSTNSGVRLGFLIVGAALFGWMFLLSSMWWMYGIGYKGRDPAWMPVEINLDRSAPVATDVVKKLPPPETLPDPVELLNKYPLIFAASIASEGRADWQPKILTNLITESTPLVVIREKGVADLRPGLDKFAKDYIAAHPELDPILAQSNAKLATSISNDAVRLRNEIEDTLGGWCLLSESDTRRGEAVASSDAALISENVFGNPTTTANYITKDVFFYGGKEPCYPITERSTIDQAWHRIATTVEVKNPALYSVVNVVRAKDVVVADGATPPPPSADPGASTVSVIQLRNLGNRRFIPFVIAVITGLLFAVFASQLHTRDKKAMAARAAFEESK